MNIFGKIALFGIIVSVILGLSSFVFKPFLEYAKYFFIGGIIAWIIHLAIIIVIKKED